MKHITCHTYGGNTAGDNQRGRIALLEDASGFRAYKYGKLGEVTEENRTFVLPNENTPYSFKTQFSYDSWNRIQDITYPDGEVVNYYYNAGGMLNRVQGYKRYLNAVIDTVGPIPYDTLVPLRDGNGDRGLYLYYYYNYVDSIHYNEFELKSGQWFGNGTRTQYGYDILQRMNRLWLYDAASTQLQNITYSYDKVGNITSIYNSAGSLSTIGEIYVYSYTYDSLYRLSTSTGTSLASILLPHYELSMQYLSDGRIARKTWSGRTKLNGSLSFFSNSFSYVYNTGQPHTPASVGVDNCSWDANGNMTGHGTKQLQWDEENRLWHTDMPNTYQCAYYQYDASGERYYKNVGTRTEHVQNGQTTVYREYDEPVLYASPYLVATPEGYTKHYFVESERIASRIGDGSFVNINAHVVPDSLLAGKQSLADSVAPGSVVPNQFSYLRGLHSNWSEHHTTYWQHGDHLGSASWVTDTNGTACQHLQYMPWGEPLVDLRSSSSSYDTRYTFSGKERDEETGFSYFGSRYYNSSLSIWLSVDPMSDKYPGTSPYTYCGNNPVKLVDPNGREIVDGQGNVCYTKEHGWLTNAPEDTKRIGNAMMETEVGKEQFMSLVESKTKIQMEINTSTTSTAYGETKFFNVTEDSQGHIIVGNATITIYERTVSDYLNETFSDKFSTSKQDIDKMACLADPTIDQYMGAVGCHEAEHLTPQNLLINKQYVKNKTLELKEELEWEPERKKYTYLRQLRDQKMNSHP